MKNVLYIGITLLLLIFSRSARSESRDMYFAEQDGDRSKIIYRAQCFQHNNKWICNLDAIQLNTEKAGFQCSVNMYELATFQSAAYSNNTWTISDSRGACGYTNTYVINESGMVQIKSSPKVKKSELCDVFEPKQYKMERITYPASLSVGKCDKLTVLFP